MKKTSVKATETVETKKSTIIGTFDGECADSNITNKNGLDITREVWENVFASEEYSEGIEHGWFIGYLGHPDDPADQSFANGCIVMTEGHLEDSGKIYGKFNLIDTPVGRIVKTFIDAGVKFGISVRGAGDIYNNSVDPDTFVFRGFDLVAFPAYPESVPEFTAIAASTDVETQKKYKAVCAAVRTNLESITSAEAIDIMQSQFAKQSEEYKMLEDRKAEISCAEDTEDVDTDTDVEEEEVDIQAQRVEGMTQLYLDTKAQLVKANAELEAIKSASEKKISQLRTVNASLSKKIDNLNNHISVIEAASDNKIRHLERITSAQLADMKQDLYATEGKYKTIKAATSKLKSESLKLHDENSRLITANEQLKTQNSDLNKSNLIYMKRIEATANDIQKKDSVISELRSELRETVTATTDIEARTSNLDAMVQKLKQEVSSATKLIQEYQDAYANLYANAIGVHLEDVRVTSATSVKELQSIIGSSNVNVPQITDQSDDIVDVGYSDDSDLVTL